MKLSTLQVAWRNLGRNRRRTLLAIGAIALGQTTLVFVNGMMAGMFADIFQIITGPLVGHVQVHHRQWREERAVDLYVDRLAEVRSEIEALPEVTRVSPRIYGPVLAASGELTDEPADAEPAMVVGVDVDIEVQKDGLLESLGSDEVPGSGVVVVGQVLARRLGIETGHEIAVIGQDADGFPTSDLFEVGAVVRGKTDVVNRIGIVMSLADAGRFLTLPDQAHELVVQGEDHREAEELAASIGAVPSLANAEVLPWKEAVPELVSMIDMKGAMDLIFVGILFVAAAAGIANTLMMSTFERTHEFGMLLAVGCRPGRVVRLILIESIFLGLIGVAVGSLLGSVAVLITGQTGIDYAVLGGLDGGGSVDFVYKGINISYMIYPKFEFRHVLFGTMAVTITSILASIWPAAFAARLEPAEAMRS